MRADRDRQKKHPAAALCNVLGTVLLIALVVFCLPLTVPRLFGCHIYSVVSGSMEPQIPVGSLVYVQEEAAENLLEGEVIAFYGALDSASIITHRVVENRVLMGELITKGDANAAEDLRPIPYENVIGKVVRTIPGAGKAAELLTSKEGKVLAACVIGAAVLLQLIAGLIERITA